MGKKLSRTVRVVAASLAVYAGAAMASSPNTPEAVIAKTLSGLPKMPAIEKVTRLPYSSGIYEVITSTREIFYADEKAELLFIGELIDTKRFRNLTEERLSSLNDWERVMELKDRNAFVHRKGNGRREIVVFTDPVCPFCKKFEEELLKLDNVTIYYFPVKYLNSARFPDLPERIWCAEDRLSAWRNWMLKGTMPPYRTCDTAVITHNTELAASIGVKGVPTTFLKDGSLIRGSTPWQEIEKRLDPVK